MKRIFYVVNVDWFFLSHRLHLAISMKTFGYEVFILSKDTGRKKEIESYGLNFINIDFERSGKNPLKEILILGQLVKYYKRFRPDIVHHVTIKPAIYGSISKRIAGSKDVKIINAISGLGYNFIDNRDGILQKILKQLMKFAFTDVNFIFQNPDDLALYQQLGYLKRNKYRIIKGAGVDSEEFAYHPPLDKEKIHIILTARMLYDKGILEFIEAANILYEEWHGKIFFSLIGDIDLANLAGISEMDLKKLMRPGYIEWFGYRSDIRQVLIDSDIVCLPSYREGLPKSLIEAMAIGRPIITTDVPGCRECVNEGVNGFMVPARDAKGLAEALLKLLSNKLLRITMGKASREKMVKELSLDKVISDTLEFYQTI